MSITLKNLVAIFDSNRSLLPSLLRVLAETGDLDTKLKTEDYFLLGLSDEELIKTLNTPLIQHLTDENKLSSITRLTVIYDALPYLDEEKEKYLESLPVSTRYVITNVGVWVILTLDILPILEGKTLFFVDTNVSTYEIETLVQTVKTKNKVLAQPVIAKGITWNILKHFDNVVCIFISRGSIQHIYDVLSKNSMYPRKMVVFREYGTIYLPLPEKFLMCEDKMFGFDEKDIPDVRKLTFEGLYWGQTEMGRIILKPNKYKEPYWLYINPHQQSNEKPRTMRLKGKDESLFARLLLTKTEILGAKKGFTDVELRKYLMERRLNVSGNKNKKIENLIKGIY